MDDQTPDVASRVTRHEEELRVGTRTEAYGSVVLRKTVDSGLVSEPIPRDVESAEAVSTPPLEGDSGEVLTLPDGSVSVPVFEEEIVVTKRLKVRERIVIRKTHVTEEARVEAELRRERVDVEADPGTMDVASQNPPG
jgi:stress response protein YsnF